MNEMNNTRRRSLTRPVVATVTVVAIGVLTIAATGGVQALKSWLLRVEIDGEPTLVELDDQGRARLSVETADGGKADIRIQEQRGADGDETRVRVRKETSDMGLEDEVVVRRGAPPMDAHVYTVDDLAAADVLHEWADESGAASGLYALPHDAQPGARILLATTCADGTTDVRRIGETPYELFGDGIETVTTVENGRARIETAGPATQNVVVLLIDPAAAGDGLDEPPGDGMVQIGEDGTIRIELTEPDDE